MPSEKPIASDPDELRLRVAALEEENRRLRGDRLWRLELFENNPHPMFIYDLETLGFLAVNHAAVHHYGFSEVEFHTMTIKDLRPAEDVPALLENLARVRDTVQKSSVWRHRKKDGSVFYAQVTSHALDFKGRRARLVLTDDITERKQAEEALRESEERWKFALQAADMGAWKLNLVDHTAWRSLRHDQIFGYQELLPAWTYEMFLEHVIEEDHAQVDRRFQHALASGEDWNFQCRIRRVDGEVRWILAQGQHVANALGRPVSMFGLVQDITAHKEAEQSLQRAYDLLEERVAARTAELALAQQRLQSEMTQRVLGQEALVAAGERERERIGRELHDGLCQILIGARLKTEFLAQLEGQPREAAQSARAAARLIAEAIEEARGLARGLTPLENVPDGLMSALQQLAEGAEKMFGVSCACEIPRPILVSDATLAGELFRIAQEAVNNALKHARPKSIRIRLELEPGHLVLAVSNDGRPFPKRPGTAGMGMKTMRYRAERIGATLELGPGTPRGTVVRCIVPLRPGESRVAKK